MHRLIRAVLFDLGGTLMYARGEWPAILEQADRALCETLAKQDIRLEAGLFRQKLQEYYSYRDQALYETTYHFVLREVLRALGYPETPEALIRSALDAMFQITQANWILERDAIPTLRMLSADGYRLGLISNAGDDQDVQQLVRRFGLEQYFDFVLTSAACSYRKPHERIFEIALGHWIMQPAEAAMIGDTLEADVLGAKTVGLYAIWLTRRARTYAQAEQHIQPDAVIAALDEVPALLRGLR